MKNLFLILFLGLSLNASESAEKKSLMIQEDLTKEEMELANELDKNLLEAAIKGNLEDFINALITETYADKDIFTDINATDNNGKTSLMLASEKGYKDIVEYALKEGADIDLQDNDDNTALMLATKNGHENIIKLLDNLEKNKDNTPNTQLLENAHSDNLQGVEDAIKSGANINAINRNLETALYWASYNGNTKMVELLIKAGADVNLGSPLKAAIDNHNVYHENGAEIAELLLKAGATFNNNEMKQATGFLDMEGKPNANKNMVELRENWTKYYEEYQVDKQNSFKRLFEIYGVKNFTEFYDLLNKSHVSEYLIKDISNIVYEYMGLSFIDWLRYVHSEAFGNENTTSTSSSSSSSSSSSLSSSSSK